MPRFSLGLSAALSGLLLLGRADPARAGDPVSALLFGSLDAGPSGFVTAGAKLALDRIDREGVAVLASVGTGRRAEVGPAREGTPSPALMRWTMLGTASSATNGSTNGG